MEKVNPLSALWRVFKGREQSNTDVLDLDEIAGENPELVEVLKRARSKAEAKAENRFKDELYKQANQKSTKDSKSIAKSKSQLKAITKEDKSQITRDDM
ncbi:MAG: hypothetical protein J6D03_03220 [Clostridia bacterium]|nr:hypothetical protein [Clostridia bacterium]